MPNLTRRFIESLGRDPLKRDVTHWDDGLSGFGLRVRASGAMSWIIMYRNRDGRLRKYTIGRIGTLTPDQARKEARLKLAAVYQGADPSSEKNAQRKALTVSELCDCYQEYSKDRIKPTTWKMNASRIECHVKPLLGKRKAASLKIEDIENLQRDVAAGISAKPGKRAGRGGTARGGKGVAARVVSMMGTILEYARRQGIAEGNAARGVRKYAAVKRTRFLSYEEIALLGEMIRTAQARGENQTALAAIVALLLTGCWRQEILDLPKEWLDLARKCIRASATCLSKDFRAGRRDRDVHGSAPLRVRQMARPQALAAGQPHHPLCVS